jgi:hypothetical protein
VPSLGDIGTRPFDGGTTAGVFARTETPPPRPSTRTQFAAYMKDQVAAVSELVKSGLLKPE